MFRRCAETDGELTALFPFKSLAHSFIIAGYGVKFDPEKEKQSNNNMRRMLLDMQESVRSYIDPSDQSAVSKGEHYVRMLQAQLVICDKTDKMIDTLCQPFPSYRPRLP
jgi:hypothetical protein